MAASTWPEVWKQMAAKYISIAELEAALPDAWSLETSSKWSAENPARGQCSVTALIVQDIFGGTILKTRVTQSIHFYNRIDDERIDLTISQFREPVSYDDISAERGEALADTSPQQHSALRKRLGLKG